MCNFFLIVFMCKDYCKTIYTFSKNRPLGRFFPRVALSVYIYICQSPSRVIFFEASHWSSDRMILIKIYKGYLEAGILLLCYILYCIQHAVHSWVHSTWGPVTECRQYYKFSGESSRGAAEAMRRQTLNYFYVVCTVMILVSIVLGKKTKSAHKMA